MLLRPGHTVLCPPSVSSEDPISGLGKGIQVLRKEQEQSILSTDVTLPLKYSKILRRAGFLEPTGTEKDSTKESLIMCESGLTSSNPKSNDKI